MKLTTIQPRDYKKMPWKNGQGFTTEIAIHPPNSKLENNNFDWRLSSAEINESGYFSEFPDCKRILAMTSGNGVRLSFSSGETTLNTNDVFCFEGAEKVFCTLLDGKVQDLGLIIKKSQFYSEFQILNTNLEKIELFAGSHIILALSGELTLETTLEITTLREFSSALLTVESTAKVSITINNHSVYALIGIFEKK